jgi:hypothetical protein
MGIFRSDTCDARIRHRNAEPFDFGTAARRWRSALSRSSIGGSPWKPAYRDGRSSAIRISAKSCYVAANGASRRPTVSNLSSPGCAGHDNSRIVARYDRPLATTGLDHNVRLSPKSATIAKRKTERAIVKTGRNMLRVGQEREVP